MTLDVVCVYVHTVLILLLAQSMSTDHEYLYTTNRVPFFVAAPTTTLDPACPSGKSIVIEERPPEELTHFRGERVVVEGMQVGIRTCILHVHVEHFCTSLSSVRCGTRRLT